MDFPNADSQPRHRPQRAPSPDTVNDDSRAEKAVPRAYRRLRITKIKWETGVFKRFPVFGMVTLLLSIACTGVAVHIHRLAHHTNTNEWSGYMTHPVLLEITTSLANLFTGLAFAAVGVISYWKNAIRGMRMGDLHYRWAAATSPVGALESLSFGYAVGTSLICLLVTASTLLRGPLMQMALVIIEGKRYATDTLTPNLAVVVSLAGPLATFVLFWGWWELGRTFSFSPLELANAFLASSRGKGARSLREWAGA